MMSGQCTGRAFIATTFEMQVYGTCRDCSLRDVQTEPEYEIRCHALDGVEKTNQCEALAEFIRFEGIRLYGMNKPCGSKKRFSSFGR